MFPDDGPSRFRIVPHPVAVLAVLLAVAITQDDAAVVGLVPTDGIEQKVLFTLAPIIHGSAADDVAGHPVKELRHERGEGGGIISIREPVSFQRANNLRLIHLGLVAGHGFRGPAEIGNAKCGNEIVGGGMTKRFIPTQGGGFGLVR